MVIAHVLETASIHFQARRPHIQPLLYRMTEASQNATEASHLTPDMSLI